MAAAGRAARALRRGQGPAREGKTVHRFAGFEQITRGTLDAQQYDEAIGDLVAYLQWMGEPSQGTRVRVGVGVLHLSRAARPDHLAPELGVLENAWNSYRLIRAARSIANIDAGDQRACRAPNRVTRTSVASMMNAGTRTPSSAPM